MGNNFSYHQKSRSEVDFNKQEPDLSHENIWVAFLSGSNKALADLYKLYSNKLFVYGRQFTHCNEQIYDTIQDVFFYLTESREKLSMARSVKLYLFSVFRRMLLKSIEKERLLVSGNASEIEGFQIIVDEAFFPVHAQLDNRQRKRIEVACNQLPARQREMLILRFFEGMSYEEIADIMGLANSKTVRTMLYRSYHKLSEILAPHKHELSALAAVFNTFQY
ncbi:RNA polymerase sigma factor [Cyclobacterium plantarum]|uniref:Sigma-70 family RNA polymerase sigma factor n=1 Tax=Cyclobacterium plantarum TaxID=2716263 RepID=A0ABX0HA35_9BACT|nr:sigma-70 family RNA polymerase sigma factor [Cyclobacterium plantarum]NHE56855.1 sigma-70 family RNA polymerase sigma factor [Cyclobacterium plantarum]